MFSKQPKNITNNYHNVFRLNNEIDYQKLADAIVKAQQKAEEQKEFEQRFAEEKQKNENMQNRLKKLGCAEYFDEKGNPKSQKAKFKLVWGIIKAKESVLKDVSIIDSIINSIVALVFAAIEWILYIIAFVLMIFGVYNIIQFILNYNLNDAFFSYFMPAVDFIISALVSFLLSRLIIRMLKIDCKYNKDSHYMMDFLAVIISTVALIVSILKK